MPSSCLSRPERQTTVSFLLVCLVFLLGFSWFGLLAEDTPSAATVLGAGDTIKIHVADVQELEKEVKIPEEGMFVYLPIGTVRGSGRTAAEIAEEIRKRLADGYVRNPSVTVIVVDTAGKNVMAIGAVMKPGPVPAKGGISMLELLSYVGGLKESTSIGGFRDGSSKEAVIVRKGASAGSRVQGERVSLLGLLGGNLDQNVMLYGGDVVIFPSITETVVKVNVLGAVGRPGQYPLTEGMTVVDFIAMAGGPTDRAGDQALIISGSRAMDGKEETPRSFAMDNLLSGKGIPDVKLRAGDTIVVLASREVAENFFIIGPVRHPGMYPWRDGLTVLNCISIAGGLTDRATTNGLRIIKDGGAGNRPSVRVDTSHSVERGDTIVVPEGWF